MDPAPSTSKQKQKAPKQPPPNVNPPKQSKPAKVAAPNFGAVANRDLLQRMNFLYQSSAYLNTIIPQTPSSSTGYAPPGRRGRTPGRPVIPEGRRRSKKRWPKPGFPAGEAEGPKNGTRRQATIVDLSREYIKNMKAVGRKSVMRIDPAVKRTICKSRNCDTVMIPGANVNVRVQSSRNHGHTLSYICPTCGRKRRIPCPSTATPHDEEDTTRDAAADEQGDTVMEDPPQSSAAQQPSTSEKPTPANATSKPAPKPKKIPRRPPSKPPLFADREAGHVVLRGKDKVVEDEDGILSWAC
ncbi:Rpr2-domain-containing protein [Schizophyllum commune Tattone D]|nr:Rpr2-domain-containing protein [Schizophyllum commune Loenen D]KAI5834063.1 Rpr2-domain-containing protein [Schizophyllum commune Tattone D]